MDGEGNPNDTLNLIIESRNNVESQQEKAAEKTASKSITIQTNNSTSIPVSSGLDDNLAKILARRSQGVNISDGDLFAGHNNVGEEVAIDFGPEDDIPGAYSGKPGADYGRIEKTPLPQQLLGDATQRKPKDGEKESDNPPGETKPVQEWSFRDVDKADSARRKKRCRIFLVSIGSLLFLLAIIRPTVLLLGDRQGNEEEEVDGWPADETMLVPNMTQSTTEALKDRESYQFRAYEWAKDDPNWDTYEPWRKQQRFAMACIYNIFLTSHVHSTYWASSPLYHKWMNQHFNECQWQDHLPSGGCDSNEKIVTLDLSRSTLLKGFVPPEVAFLTRLESIQFSSSSSAYDCLMTNNLETLLPLHQTNFLPALKTLNISDCSLAGSIPSTLGLLTTLTTLDLSQNALTSTIPSELGLLTQLKSLLLSWNYLSGTISDEIGELPLLTEFGVDNNTGIEPLLRGGFCTENHTQMELLRTNWCWSVGQCCEGAGI